MKGGKKRPATTLALTAAATIAGLCSLLLGDHISLAGADPAGEPPEFRRVLLKPEQLPAEMERVRRGVLRQMPLAEFDDLLARSTSAATSLRQPPQLAEARYRARLNGESLTGSAMWKVMQYGPTPGLMSLEPFGIALRKSVWDDGSPALIGDLDPRPQSPGLELLVGRPGEQSLAVDWSARGVPEPAGLRFDLRLPACPVAVLDLDLPADCEPIVPHDRGVLAGPTPSPAADRRIWSLAFAKTSQIDLLVCPVHGKVPPLVLAGQRSRQDVTPGQTACEFNFDLEAPRGGVRELILECDTILRPIDVGVRNLESWEVRPAPDERQPTRVFVKLREPLESGTLTLRAIAPAALDRPWASPAARVAGAVPCGEVLTLRVDPDVQLTDWQAGAFRLAESAVSPHRWQVLTLQTGLIRTSAGRPTARLRPTGLDYRVRERLWWAAAADRVTLTAELSFDVARGPVFQVPLRISEGWEVERVESDPPELLASVSSKSRLDLLADLQRPLTPGNAGTLIVHLRRRPPHAETISFPDVLPTEARGREGSLAVRVGAGLQSTVSDAPALDPKAPGERGLAPWGDAPADYVFPLHAAAVDGTLHLRPRPVHYRASVATDVGVVGREVTVVCRLRMEPEAGGADDLVLHVAGTTEIWDWQVVQGANRVRSVQRLAVPPPALTALLAARTPFDAAIAAGVKAGEPNSWWRIALARPVAGPLELEARTTATLPADDSWAVPLVRTPAANADDNQVTVDLRSAPGWRTRTAGMTDVATPSSSRRHRTFSYTAGQATLALVHSVATDEAIVDQARLVTYATDTGRLVHRLGLRLQDWGGRTLPIDLPANAIVQRIRVNGAVVQVAAALNGGQLHLDVPAAIGGGAVVVDVVYTTPRAGGEILTSLEDEPPQLPAGALPHRVWCLPPDSEPLQSPAWRRLPADDIATDGMMPGDLGDGIFWEPANGTGGDSIRFVRPREVGIIGGVVALAGLALSWVGRRWQHRRQWIGLLGWLAVTAAAVIWLPQPLATAAQWPLLAAVLAAAWKLLPVRPRPEPPTVAIRRSSSSARVVTAGLLVLACLSPRVNNRGMSAAGPAPTLVYLVPGPAEAPEPKTVLVPPELVERLRTLARRGPAGLDGAVWIDARYDGRVAGGSTEFTATFHLHSFADDPPPLALPLTGVQLGEATLDGSPAFLRSARDLYFVPIHGRGPHTLELQFAVSVSGSGADREVRLGVPEIANSRLTLAAPVAATHLQAMSWRGEQRVETGGDRPRLEVDLGRVGAVQARWQTEVTTPRTTTVRTQEAYLWDLTESAARLFGSIQFAVGPGTVTSLAVALPKDLEVTAVTARLLDTQPTGAISGWLRSWHVALPSTSGGRRSLVLEFAAPINGSWQVNFELVPREPFPSSFSLPFPSAIGARSIPPVFAWRAEGVELSDQSPDNAAPLTPDVFLRDHWSSAKAEADPRPPTKAYRRTALGQAPALKMRAASGVREQATADIAWRIGRRRADVEATGHVTIPDGRLSLIEWTVPPAVTVADVRGADVHTWSRTGNRLQVWLAKSAAESTLHITGFVTRASEAERFDVPPLRPRAALRGGALRVTAAEGLALSPVQTIHLTESAPAVADGRQWAFAIEAEQMSSPYRATFDVRRVVAPSKLAIDAAKPRKTSARIGKANTPPPSAPVEIADSENADADLSGTLQAVAWPGRLLRTAAVLIAGLLGIWIGRRFPAVTWPEQMSLLGVATFASAGVLLWLLPTAIGIAARLTILVAPKHRPSQPEA